MAGRVVAVAGALVAAVALWEGYKWMGQATDGTWPGTSFGLPVRADDLTMPHAVDVWSELWRPVQRNRDEVLAVFLAKAALSTLWKAALGFALGVVVGWLLAVLMLRSRFAERGLLPWINISQTVPLIALAPIVVTWGRTNSLSDSLSVALIATYLTFFPVAVNALRGLQSPSIADLELMRSYAATPNEILFKVRLPASRPYLFPALRLATTLSVVGAIVGVMDTAQWDQTVEVATGEEVLAAAPDEGAYTTEYAEAAVAMLEAQGVDVTGEGWSRIDVELTAGGE
jgi:NitT/TauT family transport system permease protein